MKKFLYVILLLALFIVFSFVKKQKNNCFKSVNNDFVIERVTIEKRKNNYQIVIVPFTREKARYININNLNDTLYNDQIFIPDYGLKLKGLFPPIKIMGVFNSQRDTLYSILVDKKGTQRIDTLTTCE
jgi:hypothetical protein